MPTAASLRRLANDGSFASGSISSLVSISACRVAAGAAPALPAVGAVALPAGASVTDGPGGQRGGLLVDGGHT